MRLALLTLLALMWSLPAGAVGFQRAELPDPQGGTLELAIWYPADAPTAPHRLGPYTQAVATDAAIRGHGLALVLLSHGSGGNLANHVDTALALAEAGFVVAALSHKGDSTDDLSLSGTTRGLANRPRQYVLALDWLLESWPGHSQLDPRRVGGFGHSAGAFTVLVAAGGEPNLGRIPLHCATQPADPSCRLGRPGEGIPQQVNWAHTPRLRALVVAAPALGYTFVPQGLAQVTQPVQLWRSSRDEVLLHPWHAQQVRNGLTGPVEFQEVGGAGHYAFLAPCPAGMAAAVPEICTDLPGFDRTRFHLGFNAALVAFFQERLK